MSKLKQVSMRAIPRNAKGRRPAPTPATRRPNVEVRELDPLRKCGPGTTVELMFRVIERADGGAVNHLVFLDRHGWYCEHGRTCRAVALARGAGGGRRR